MSSFKPGSRRFIVLMGALTAQAAIAVDVLLPALPAMVEEVGVSAASAQLTIGLFIAGFAVGQIGWGWLSDWLGRKPIILMGTGGYIIMTFLCAVADSGTELLVWRFVLGIFASASVTITRAILRDHFTGVQLARQMAAMMVIFFMSPMLAPQLGTLLLFLAGWRSVFWVPGIISIVCFVVIWTSLAESHPVAKRRRSSLLQIFGTAIDMVRHPMSGLCLAIHASMSVGLLAWISSSSLILTGFYGVEEYYFGLFFTVTAAVQLAGSVCCNRLLKSHSPSYVMGLGGACCAVGGVTVFAVTILLAGPLWSLMVGVWFFMFGFGLIVPAAGGLALHAFGTAGGLAAAIMGSIQSFLGSGGSVLSAFLYDGTARSLGIGIGLSAIAACLFALMLSHRLRVNPELLDPPAET